MMTGQNIIEQSTINFGLLKDLLDAGAIFHSFDAGGDGQEVFDPEYTA